MEVRNHLGANLQDVTHLQLLWNRQGRLYEMNGWFSD